MKRSARGRWTASARLLVAVAAASLAAWGASARAQEPAAEENLVITGYWPPFMDAEARGGGVVTQFVSAVFAEMGIEPTYEFLPTWSNALSRAGEDGALATFSWARDREDIEGFRRSDDIYSVTFRVFVDRDRLRRGDFDGVDAVEDLRGFRGVRMAGYLNLDVFESGETVSYEATRDAFEALLAGDVDFVVEARRVGEAVIERDFFLDKQRFAMLDPAPFAWPRAQVVLFCSDYPGVGELVDRFNEALERVRRVTSVELLLEQAIDDSRERHVVRLTDPGAFSLVTGKETPDSEASYIIPRGTVAVVVKWSANFEAAEVTTVHRQMNEYTQVRLLNGPLKDRVLWVRNMFIELPDVAGLE